MATNGYYIGWVGYQNLGDEVLWDLCRSFYPGVEWTPVSPQSGRIGEHKDAVALLGGGTLINSVSPRWIEVYRGIRERLQRPVLTWGTGVEDPKVFRNTVGWYDQREMWKREFAHLPIVGVRGPKSKALLDDIGLTNVHVVGDPGVLLHRKVSPNTRKPKAKGVEPLRFGFNYGFPAVPMMGSLENLDNVLTKVLLQLGGEGHDIEVFAVWYRDILACTSLASKASIPPHKVKLLSDGERSLDLLSSYDLVVSFRLHAAILSCARNVPVILLEYTPKCSDFAASVNLLDYTISCDEVSPEKLLDCIRRACASLRLMRENIDMSMNALRTDFERYAKQISTYFK